jgi:outer membrane protein assembly factor BamB
MIARLLPLLMVAALTGARPASAADPSPADLVGTWSGEVSHAGESSPIEFRLERGDSGRVEARFSLPALHAFDIALGRARIEDGELRLGPFAFSYDSSAGTLNGVLPAILIPVHSVPVVLRRGAAIERAARPELAAPVAKPAWTFATGASIWSDVAWSNGLVFAGNDEGRLHALDARTGASRWSFHTDGALRARPTVSGNDLYVPADDGCLYRLDARRGRLRWKVRLQDSAIIRLPITDPGSKFDFYASAVTIAGGRLFVGTHDGRVLALAPGDGARVWEFATGGPILAAPAVEGGRVFAGSYDGKVYALDARTGRLLWSYDTRAPVTSTPAPVAGRVVVGSRSYDLFGLDAATGAVVWDRYIWYSWIESSARVRDGVAYVGSSDAAKVFAVDAATGRSVWETDVHGITWGSPAVTADRVFAAVRHSPSISDHQAALVALDRGTGRPVWRYPYPAPAEARHYGFGASPAIGDGRVFAGAIDGIVYAFETAGPR